jgi:hypothetical protein
MDSDTQLIKEIRQHCEAHHWYGVDLRGPEWETSIAQDDPRRTGFVCAPATTDQIEETETLFSFSLPPFLRLIYTRLANGGFGPAYGLTILFSRLGSGSEGFFPSATGDALFKSAWIIRRGVSIVSSLLEMAIILHARQRLYRNG